MSCVYIHTLWFSRLLEMSPIQPLQCVTVCCIVMQLCGQTYKHLQMYKCSYIVCVYRRVCVCVYTILCICTHSNNKACKSECLSTCICAWACVRVGVRVRVCVLCVCVLCGCLRMFVVMGEVWKDSSARISLSTRVSKMRNPYGQSICYFFPSKGTRMHKGHACPRDAAIFV